MKIVFFDRAFSQNKGGIERVCSNLIFEMTRRGHQCTVIAINKNLAAPAVFSLPEGTRLINTKHNRFFPNGLLFRSRVLAEKPDVFVIMTGVAGYLPLWCLLSLKSTGIPVIASEHLCPEFVEKGWNSHDRLVYLSSVDRIHLLMESYRESLPAFLQDRIAVIPNPLAPVQSQGHKKDNSRAEKTIVAVGTLFARQPKQIHLLVDAFAFIKDQFPDWRVNIYGSGPDKKKIERQINKRKLAGRVFLNGVTEDIDGQLALADLFCMPSSHEGCPCALQEAMAHGLPSVGFADCPGVNELIADGENGLLAKEMNAKSLADALGLLMSNPKLRYSMGNAAIEKSKIFFSSFLYDKWEKILKETAQRAGNTILSLLENKGEPDYLFSEIEQMSKKNYLGDNKFLDLILNWRSRC